MNEQGSIDPDLLRWLRFGLIRVKQWNQMDEKIGNGLVVILKSSSQPEYPSIAKSILESISRSKPEKGSGIEGDPPELESLEKVAKSWAEGLLPIVNAIVQEGHDAIVTDSLKVPGQQGFYINIVIESVKLGSTTRQLRYLAPAVKPQLIIDDLTSYCNQGRIMGPTAIAILSIIDIGRSWDWERLAEALRKRLDSANNLPPSEIEGCLSILQILSEENILESVTAYLNELCAGGHLLHHLNQANSEKGEGAAARCLISLLEFNPGGSLPDPSPGSSASGQNYYNSLLGEPNGHQPVVNEFYNLMLEQDRITWLIETPEKSANTTNFIVAVLELIAQRSDAHNYITPNQFTSHFSFFIRELSKEVIGELIKQLLSESQLIQFLIRHGFSSQLAGLYLLVLDSIDSAVDSGFIDFIAAGLRNINEDSWSEEISSEGQVLELAMALGRFEVEVNPSSSIQDALLAHTRDILQGHSPPSRLDDEWGNILLAMSDHSRMTFLRDLRDILLASHDTSIAQLLRLYGNSLLNSGVLEEKADEFVRTVLSGILDRADPEEIAWLRDAIASHPDIVKKAMRASRRAFEDKVKVTYSELAPEAEIANDIELIANTLRIKLEPREMDEDEQLNQKSNKSESE